MEIVDGKAVGSAPLSSKPEASVSSTSNFDFTGLADILEKKGYILSQIVNHIVFLRDILGTDPAEWVNFRHYELTYGDVHTSEVHHLLHWPPAKPTLADYGSLDWTGSYSLGLVSRMFPEYCKHSASDLYCKWELIYTEDGQRKTNDQIYGNSPLLPCQFRRVKAEVKMSAAVVFVVYGKPAEAWFVAEFGITSVVSGRSTFTLNGSSTLRTAFFLPHPKHVQRWATRERVQQVVETLETLAIEYDVKTDTAALLSLHKGLDGHVAKSVVQQLRKVGEEVKRKSPEEIEARRVANSKR